MPPDPDDQSIIQGMEYYAAAHGRKPPEDEKAVLERLGIHQDRRFTNGDANPRAYTNSLPRGQNYYVPPSPNLKRNGDVSRAVTANRRQDSKMRQMMHSFTCCLRIQRPYEDHRPKDFFLPAPKPRRKHRNRDPTQRVIAHANGLPENENFINKWWSQNRQKRLRNTNKGTMRPSKLSIRNHPSPLLGVNSPRTDRTLLPTPRAHDSNKSCLIVDLDETLVHSSFKPVEKPDFIVPVEIDGVVHKVYVIKRPFVDEFLQKIGEWFECVLFTASLAKYADPVANLLDRWGVFRYRLFREACVMHKGSYIKDLNRLGRELKRVIILDNSPASYAYHPDNAIPVQSWFDDRRDTELLDLLPFLERLARVDDIYSILRRTKDEMGTRRAIRAKRR